MPTYKLMYFNIRDRAEVARMMFFLKGQPYEDHRVKMEDWLTLRTDTTSYPLGQLPVLIVDHQAMPQSEAINRYLAREFGFYGQNNKEAALIDVISETKTDIRLKVASCAFGKDARNVLHSGGSLTDMYQVARKKWAMSQKEFQEWAKPYFTFLQESLRKAGGKHFVGDSLTLADLEVFHILDQLKNSVLTTEGILDQYPDLEKFYKAILEDSPLTEYLASRPFTPF